MQTQSLSEHRGSLDRYRRELRALRGTMGREIHVVEGEEPSRKWERVIRVEMKVSDDETEARRARRKG